MIAVDRRSRIAFAACLLASLVGWLILPFAPGPMPGEPFPGVSPVLQEVVAWWPLSMLVSLAIALALPRLASAHVAWRGALRVLQWLLTLASVALTLFCLFQTLSPRPY